jgi:hypothetical protein
LTKVSHFLCITEGTQCMVFIQSCTISLPVLQCSCSEISVTCIDAYDVLSMNRQNCDMDCQGEEIPFAISFTKIECVEDELSYICVCPFLGSLCQYPEILIASLHLHIYVDLST